MAKLNQTILVQDASSKVTIELDGNKANIVAGGAGHNGDLRLKDREGKTTIKLSADNGNLYLGGNDTNGDIRVREDRGETVISLSARTGNIVAGGHGKDGDIVLLDDQSKARWIMEAYDASLEAKNADGEITFRIDGKSSEIFLTQVAPKAPKTVELAELEAIGEFYAEFKHLPEMPSPEEMEKGIPMKEFSMQLLSKVEEMTQYIVLLERKIREMESNA